MLRIEMMPAERGDAILIDYGTGEVATNHVLVDGGPVNSGRYGDVRARLECIPADCDGRRYLDLLVVTHVDSDHIEGVIRLVQDDRLRCVFEDIWYNGWRHLRALDATLSLDVLGAAQGEFLGALLRHQGRPWNQFLSGGPVVVPDEGPLPVLTLRGGLMLTVLSPSRSSLSELGPVWDEEVRAAGFEPGDDEAAVAQLSSAWWARPDVLGSTPIAASRDSSKANGASIALLAEFAGRSVLLAGDAHADVLTQSLRRLRAERHLPDDRPFHVDAFKLAHHGSRHNTTAQLLAEVTADHYLVSTSGHRFEHPDAEAIAAVLDAHTGLPRPALLFNYRQPNTEIWERSDRDTRYGSEAILTLT